MSEARGVRSAEDEHASPAASAYLTVKQAAEVLHVNQKKLYALIQDGGLPATKASGKWLVPRKLLDEWMLEQAHGGVLTDRLLIGGSDDPLLASAVTLLASEIRDAALVAICPTGTRLGLELLAGRRINVCAIHWGVAESSRTAHVQLVAGFPGSREWAIVRMGLREQGIVLARERAGVRSLAELARPDVRWASRQEGAGTQHFVRLMLREQGIPPEALRSEQTAYSERHAAALVAQGQADCAPGVRSAAGEFGLAFLPLGWEAFDLVVPRAVFFRSLFQRLLDLLRSERLRVVAASLKGYDLTQLGQLVAGADDAPR
ncbi:MAG: helix-turn-helix domain-containing protein [Burkholderiales bacterium]|nr:helix-turn-helix domain-containing protein [Burkholderiales bacterium]